MLPSLPLQLTSVFAWSIPSVSHLPVLLIVRLDLGTDAGGRRVPLGLCISEPLQQSASLTLISFPVFTAGFIGLSALLFLQSSYVCFFSTGN